MSWKGFHVGQSNGVLLKEMAAFWRCPLAEVSLYVRICTYVQLNLTIMNPGYTELPDIMYIDLRMYTYLLYCE